MVYFDKALMANGSGSNGGSTLPIVASQAMEEPKTGLVPPSGVFSDQRIFLSVL